MNATTAQEWIDRFVEASGQQWLLRITAIVSALGSTTAAMIADRQWWPLGLVVVAILATTTAIRPDTHVAVLPIAVVMWRWLATVDHIDTPWLPVAAVCLVAYHTTIALSATLPTGGELPIPVLVRALRRTALTAGITIGTWGLVVVFDQRNAPGNLLLTAAALAVVIGATAVIRLRSVGGFR